MEGRGRGCERQKVERLCSGKMSNEKSTESGRIGEAGSMEAALER